MNAGKTDTRLKNILIILSLVLVFGVIYEVGNSIYIYETTGTLSVSSPGAFLTVEQDNSRFVNIGTSIAKVRLKPGVYTLVASKDHAQASKTFVIIAKKMVNETLTISKPINPATSQITINTNKAITYLPFIGPNFSYEVSYKYEVTPSANLPVIIITAPNTSGQQAALNWLTAIGFDPSTLNIQYVVATPTPQASSQQ